MEGLFWELVGLTSSYTRAPGSGTPAGPTLKRIIHQAFLEMVRYAKPLECRKYDTLSFASVETASLPANFLDWYDLEDEMTIAGLPIRQVNRGLVEQWRDGGTSYTNVDPCIWYEAGRSETTPFARQVGLFPVPTSTVVAKIHFLRKPLALNATGISGSTEYPCIPPDFHEAAVSYAVWKWYQRRKELATKDITFLLSYYQSKLPELKRATAERLRPNFMSSTPNSIGSMLEAWD